MGKIASRFITGVKAKLNIKPKPKAKKKPKGKESMMSKALKSVKGKKG